MAEQSYKITVDGEAELTNVSCILELTKVVQMIPESPSKWVGNIEDIDVADKLDYEIFISAAGKVNFTYSIHNTSVDNEVEEDDDYTNRNIQNGAKIRGSCKPK